MSDRNSSREAILTRRQILVTTGTSGLLLVTGSWYALGQQPRRKDDDRDRPKNGGDRDRPEKGRHGKVRVRTESDRVGDSGARSELIFTEGDHPLMKMTATAHRGKGIRSLGTGRFHCEAEGDRKWGFTMDGRRVEWSDKKDWFTGRCQIHCEMEGEDFDTEFDCEDWDFTRRPRPSRRFISSWAPILKKLESAEDELKPRARKFVERGWPSGPKDRPRFSRHGGRDRSRSKQTNLEPEPGAPLVRLVSLQEITTTEQCQTSMGTTGAVIGTGGGILLGLAGGPAAPITVEAGALVGTVVGGVLGGTLAALCD